MAAGSFFAELRRRNVIRMAGLYLVGAWLVTQVAGTVLPMFGAPDWLPRSVVILLAIGFVPVLIVSWIYELTPEGLQRDAGRAALPAGPELPGTRTPVQRIDRTIIVVLLVALGFFAVDRFVFEPRRIAAARSAPATNAGSDAASIAVLPFVDMSQAKDQEYFSDGLSEELLDLLAKIPQLKVIARTSSFSFKGKEVDVATIAKALNVANVLEGSVRKSGNTLRVTAQLIRAADSTHLWSDTYDRELTDVFKVQDEISAAVVAALKLKLLPSRATPENARRTANIDVYSQVLLGRELFKRSNPDDWRSAEAAFRKALAADPAYAPAWAGLAMTLAFLSDFAGSPDAIAAAKREAVAAADQAVALAPDLADGYEARSLLRYTLLWDWEGARADVDRLSALDPNSAVALRRRAALLAAFGHVPEAVAEIRKAIVLDPLSFGARSTLGEYLMLAGDHAAARENLQQALALNPKSTFATAFLGFNELLDGKADAALAIFQRSADDALAITGVALAAHTLGHAQESQQALDRLIAQQANGSAYQIAEVYAWRGEADKAFEWLNRAADQRDSGMVLVNYDPTLLPLHADPRFAVLLKRVGLPPPT